MYALACLKQGRSKQCNTTVALIVRQGGGGGSRGTWKGQINSESKYVVSLKTVQVKYNPQE